MTAGPRASAVREGSVAKGFYRGLGRRLVACRVPGSRGTELGSPFQLFSSTGCDFGDSLIWHACSSVERR